MAKIDKEEIKRLATLVEEGKFGDLTGEEQINYIDTLKYKDGSNFLQENYELIKPMLQPLKASILWALIL